MTRLLAVISFSFLIHNVSCFYSARDAVQALDSKNFREKVIKSDGIWLVEFYAPWCGHCQKLAPEWKKAAKQLKGVVHVAAVDCDQSKDLASQYGVQGFPTIKIFGMDKKKPTDYQQGRDAESIVHAALSEVNKMVRKRAKGKSKDSKKSSKSNTKPKNAEKKKKTKKGEKDDVVTLTEKNFQKLVLQSGDVWLVEFYAPWCGHCQKLAPEWEQAASELKGSVNLGAVDATANQQLASQYGIKGYPSIKVFGPSAAGPSDVEDYEGPRTASAIVAYGLEKLKAWGGAQKIRELFSQEILEQTCTGKTSCVIAFLPHIRESGKEGREKYIEVLREVSQLVSDKPFRFGWVQGGDQSELERAFDLPFGYPSLVAVNFSRQLYVVQKGAFAPSKIAEFLNAVLFGREATVSYESLPKLKEVTEWDGKDVEVEPLEDEDDDEDILNDIIGNSNNKDEL